MGAYSVVEHFEARVAEHFGLEYGVAVDCCTSAIFLSLMYRKQRGECGDDERNYARIPTRTYVSVPFAVMDAGLRPVFYDFTWHDCYEIVPWAVWDAAKLWRYAQVATERFKNNLWCVSFHIKKPIPIGRGGMVLTNDARAAEWLRKARYDGRTADVALTDDQITTRGWHRYMTPEQAARGMALMDVYPDGVGIPVEEYPDLSKMPVFQGYRSITLDEEA